jgi:hypothetical protein
MTLIRILYPGLGWLTPAEKREYDERAFETFMREQRP